MTPWVLQIWNLSDVDAQELVLGLVRGLDGVTAEPAHSGPDYYLTVECRDVSQARSVASLVVSVDPAATLIHTTNGRVGDPNASPDAVWTEDAPLETS
jgi:hypothetical protein